MPNNPQFHRLLGQILACTPSSIRLLIGSGTRLFDLGIPSCAKAVVPRDRVTTNLSRRAHEAAMHPGQLVG